MRGTDNIACLIKELRRITPACAGNSGRFRERENTYRDHPRVCGEQSVSAIYWAKWKGSPPRVRGTVYPASITPSPKRITPACAGNRWYIDLSKRKQEDHPRVCGEQPRIFFRLALQEGSPPRVRGTGRQHRCDGAGRGITPACAGNSRRCRGGGPAGQDHPRVCGEQTSLTVTRAEGEGSPPRVRGTDIPPAPG